MEEQHTRPLADDFEKDEGIQDEGIGYNLHHLYPDNQCFVDCEPGFCCEGCSAPSPLPCCIASGQSCLKPYVTIASPLLVFLRTNITRLAKIPNEYTFRRFRDGGRAGE